MYLCCNTISMMVTINLINFICNHSICCIHNNDILFLLLDCESLQLSCARNGVLLDEASMKFKINAMNTSNNNNNNNNYSHHSHRNNNSHKKNHNHSLQFYKLAIAGANPKKH